MPSRSLELPEQPGFGKLPVAHDGLGRDLEHVGGFLDAQAAEETQLHHLALALVHLAERLEGLVDGDEVGPGFVGNRKCLGEGDLHGPAATLLIVLGTREVDKDAAHQPGGHRQKVRAVLPVDALHVDETQIGFVHQRRRLQAVTGALAGHATLRDAVQLAVDERNQLLERGVITAVPVHEQAGDVREHRLFRGGLGARDLGHPDVSPELRAG